jgi:hypothetical protein
MHFENSSIKLKAMEVLFGSDETIITLHKILLISKSELLLARS